MEEKGEFESRSYQTYIEEIAIKENSIVFLPTGSGKTFIAIQLIKRLQRSVQPAYSNGGKRTFFLANTVPLVNQHAKAIANLSSLTVKGFTSQDKVDLWKIEQWQEQLDSYQVLVMTPQILLDMLLHKYISIERINFMIFDECHAAIKNHPMRCIMRLFSDVPTEKTPRVLGLTATLLNSNVKPKNVEASLRDLESTFHSKICTCEDFDDVCKFSTNPREIVISYNEYTPNKYDENAERKIQKCIDILEKSIFPDIPSPIKRSLNMQEIAGGSKKKKIVKLLKAIQRTGVELGTYCTTLAVLVTTVKFERLQMSADARIVWYFSYCISVLTSTLGALNQSMLESNPLERITQNSSSKLKSLLSILKEYSPTLNTTKSVNIHNESLCCIIFVKERITALTLNSFLKAVKRCDPDLDFLKHDFITGFNVNPYSDTREDLYYRKQNKIVVSNFRLGLLNCLISTDLLEEGFDLPQCNLIIRFDEILSFKSYIQSKGRGRLSTASYVAMLPNSKREVFSETLKEFKGIFDNINEMLIGKCLSREMPSEVELAKVYKEAHEPYIYKNAKITISSAMSLLNRYCANLDHDKYTESRPLMFKKKINELFIVVIIMPANSALKKPIESPPMSNVKDAKHVAALMACKELHKLGDLNDNLLPADRVKEDDTVNQLFQIFNLNENSGRDSEKYGKDQTYFKKEFPKCFKRRNDEIESNTFYLHCLEMSPVKESDQPQLSEIYKMLESDRGFAIITKNKMEQLCPFSVYLSSGEVQVDLARRNVPCTISDELLDKIKRFHVTLFFNILGIKQRFVIMDNVSDENYFYIVPSYKSDVVRIDEEMLRTQFSRLECIEPSVDERKNLKVNKEEYTQSIVSPWYRSDNARYVVTEVCDYMTPYSAFGNTDYATFVDYFYTKHSLRLVGNKQQNMLKVRHIGGSNCLLPRSITLANNQNISKKKLKNMLDFYSMNPPQYEEILVPEFCVKFDFPGVLWLKAILIPSIIHRITMLSQAEELRQKIVIETGLGSLHLKEGDEWEPLRADIHAIKMSEEAIISQNNDPIDSPETPGTPERSVEKIVKDTSLESNFTKANIDLEFPWDPKQEPIDIDRNFDTVSLMDIECFDSFVNHKVENAEKKNPTVPAASVLINNVSKRAICAAPLRRNETIKILQSTLSETGPQLRSILETLTTSRCNDIINLERLETLGDSFLKFGCSMVLWHRYPKFSEGELTAIKGKLVSNKNLFFCGGDINLGGRMKTKQFNAMFGWLLPAFTIPQCILDLDNVDKLNTANFVALDIPRNEVLEGVLSQKTISDLMDRLTKSPNDELSYSLRDNSMEAHIGEVVTKTKWVSDSVEAIIGLYLLEGGIKSAFKILQWFKILPKEDLVDRIMSIHVNTPYSENKITVSDIDYQLNYCRLEIEKILGYTFGDPSYLLQALSHSSNIKNNITDSYQRLEFVGDAILDFLITSHIFENYSSLGPGDITDLRSALVNNVTFACLVVRLNLHKYIQSSNSLLESAILKFVLSQKQKGDVIDDSVVFLLEENDCTISEYIDVPKTLGDVFESLAGAIYFDSGNDLQTVWKVFYNFMYNEIVSFSQNIPKQPTRLLYEQIHASPKFLDSVRTNNGQIMVPLRFQLHGEKKTVHGFGLNKSNAKRSAAKVALKMLGIESTISI